MKIKVNTDLKNSKQHDIYKLQNKTGKVVHQLPDGKWLIEFDGLTIQKKKELRPLQWYIDQYDLTIIE